MYDIPDSLQNLCLNAICENILTYIEPVIKTNSSWQEKLESGDSFDEGIGNFKFKDPEIFLINEISEKLLEKFSERRLLSDATLHIFTEHNTKLRKFKIKNCRVSKEGLQILKQHKIIHLECINLKDISIGDVLDCLSDWSTENMLIINFSNCTFIDESRYSFMVKLSNFKNLRSLNLSYTELNQTSFRILCEDLSYLEKLNISGSIVTDLTPLKMLKDKLTSLTISHLYLSEEMSSIIEQLKYLRYLDMSFVYSKIDTQYVETYVQVLEMLENPNSLPNLRYLDVSGWKEHVHGPCLQKIIQSHPKLEFLGIVICTVTFDRSFSDIKDRDYPSEIVIAGLGNEEQIKVTLRKYKDRSVYIQKALYHLFQLTTTFTEPRPEIFNLILPVMEAHLSKFGVQMAATACLYNLTRGDLSKKIHPSILSKTVNLTLCAMETFPEEFQLQKNSLLTLCSDRILQDISFNRFKCARLVLDALCRFNDTNMDRMAVAICSILVAKVSTVETSELGAKPEYMNKLLTMVRQRVESTQSDITLKFTLSALWNLTDESAATCAAFLDQQGGLLFLEVLSVFKNNSAIETKVLGLLNNIAEVPYLRPSLAIADLAAELNRLLRSDNIDVSYFAAGIVAHLTSDGDEHWHFASQSREEILDGLQMAVNGWKVPENEMVAYRSFRPFFPLLAVGMDYRVQLWAVWAIHHVCTKNPKRYCEMLWEEKGHTLLNDLVNYQDTNPEIRRYSTLILQTLESNS